MQNAYDSFRKVKENHTTTNLVTDLGATEKVAYGLILPVASSTAIFRRYGA